MRDTAIKVLLATVTVGLLTACSHERCPEKMVAVDSLATTHPDSARKVLASMATDTVFMSESQRMYYKLLTLKADIKSYITQTSDVKAREILNYYERGGDRRLLSYAYYYAALTYKDLNDAPQAIDYLQKVIDTMPKGSDLQLESYTYNQIGKLFLFRDMDEKACEYFKLSYKVDSLRKDTVDMFDSFIDISTAYENTDTKKSLFYLNKARLLNKEGKINRDYKVDCRMSAVFSNKEEFDSALKYIQAPLKNFAYMDSSAIFSIARKAYFGKGMLDSAKYYSLKLMRMGTLYAKKNSAMTLAKIAFSNRDITSGLRYMELYDIYADSVDKIDAKQALTNANALYDYKIRERENESLKAERKNYIVGMLVLGIISSVGIALLVIRNLIIRQKRQRLNLKVFLLAKMEKEQREKSESEINAKKQEIKTLMERLQETKVNNKKMELLVIQLKEQLREAVLNRSEEVIRHKERTQKMMHSKAYLLAKAKVGENHPILSLEWEEIEEEMNILLDDFKYTLYQAHDMSDLEYHICLLIKMGFNNADISTLISRQPNAVSQARKRLYKKITKKDGKATDLDDFIKSL